MQTSIERSNTKPTAQVTHRISVVVPVRNEANCIASTLDGLLSQSYPHDMLEVFVVDGESTDETCKIVQGYAEKDTRIHLLHNPQRWSSAARNLGAKAATGDVVLIVDGHCEFVDDQYLMELDQALTRSNADCLGRPQPLDVTDGTTIQRAIAIARSSRLGHHPDSFIYSENEQFVPAHSVAVAYKRDVFDRVGYFDDRFDACEDVEFNHRIDQSGLTCLLAPQIKLRYRPRHSFTALFRQMMRYGRGRVRLAKKHPETSSLKSFLPAAFVLFLLVGLPLCLVSGRWALLYAATCGFYALIVSTFSLYLAWQNRDPALFGLLPVTFFSIHAGAGYGSLYEWLVAKSMRTPSVEASQA